MVIRRNTLAELWQEIKSMQLIGYCLYSNKDIKKDEHSYSVELA